MQSGRARFKTAIKKRLTQCTGYSGFSMVNGKGSTLSVGNPLLGKSEN